MDTISSYLGADHERCDGLYRRALGAVLSGSWPQARRAFADFSHALERHLLLEERIVFPAFEAATGSDAGPTSTMRAEHLGIRAVVERMAVSLRQHDAPGYLAHAASLTIVLYQHCDDEEGVVYPMIERVLAGRRNSVLAAIEAFGTADRLASAA